MAPNQIVAAHSDNSMGDYPAGSIIYSFYTPYWDGQWTRQRFAPATLATPNNPARQTPRFSKQERHQARQREKARQEAEARFADLAERMQIASENSQWRRSRVKQPKRNRVLSVKLKRPLLLEKPKPNRRKAIG